MRFSLGLCFLLLAGSVTLADDPAKTEVGEVHFKLTHPQDDIPEFYQLKEHKFPYRMTLEQSFPVSGFDVYKVTFPSPVKSPHPVNNTVHGTYYKPRTKKKFPCVVVLHITGGDQALSRTISKHLAQNGIGALFLQMAYYGPRRPQGIRIRLLSKDINNTVAAVRQTVLDVRRATAWMESRPEVNGKRLGILGTSLGGFVSALSAEMEPKLDRVVIFLAGGGFVDGFYDDPRAAPMRIAWEFMGGNRAIVERIIAPIDPITCAKNLRKRKVLMLAANKDEIVPPKMATALWEQSGRQKIVWFNAGHYTAILYLVPALEHAVKHLRAE